MIGRVLFVDNDPDFMETRSEFLRRAGYEVFQAPTLSEAEWLLNNVNIHLAIIDIRMRDDNDEKDISGLTFAKNPAFHVVPKIILTGFTSLEYVREVMRPSQTGLPPAVDFVAKQDGHDVLINAVNRVFNEIVLINFDQRIDWQSYNSFSLVSLIEPGLKGDQLSNRASELEDLIHSIFPDKEYLRIERLLWHRNGRVSLVVFAFHENIMPESYIVICGQNSPMNDEIQRYTKFAPKAQGTSGTSLFAKGETIHYGAAVYALTDNILESFQTLRDLYNTGPEKTFNSALAALFNETLREWHQDKPIPVKTGTTSNSYLESLGLSDNTFSKALLENYVTVIEQQVPTLGVQINRSKENLTIQYKEQSYSLPDPVYALSLSSLVYESELLINVPGDLTGGNILVDGIGHTWLTDFAEAGQAPLFWNYVVLESAIRFDWVDTNDIMRRHEMERCLINAEFSRLDPRNLEPVVRKPVRAIQGIRKVAARTVGRDVLAYHQGILFQALRRLVDVDIQSPLTASELVRITHIFISIAIITEILLHRNQNNIRKIKEGEYPELQVDVTTRTVMIGHQSKRLAPRPFELLQYLYENADRVCTTDELRKNVIGENYNDTYIHTLVGRVRDVVEIDPAQARYLISEPNLGYQLILHPK